MTSTLILLFLYIGFISLQAAIDDPRRADRAGAVLALVGVINVPIIYFSVQWWNTLHQGATIRLTRQAKHRGSDARGVVDHAGRLLALLGGGCADSLAMHYSGTRAERFSIRGGRSLIMNWPDLSMGGYGFYVWGSYLFSLIAIVWEVVSLSQSQESARATETTAVCFRFLTAVLRGSTNETTS